MKYGRKTLPLLLLACVLLLTACGSGDREVPDLPPEPEEGVLVYAALNPVSSGLRASVESFNKDHPDVQIEIRDYSDEDGVQRLQVELMAGRVPDMMEMYRRGEDGWIDSYRFAIPVRSPAPEGQYFMPYRQLVQKGYLEDLWPYIENDPELGREGVLEAPLQAAGVDGGLYMLFGETVILTLMGPERVVGDRTSWTVEELMETFSTMPEGSAVLEYTLTQRDVFSRLLSYSLDRYVDWETGETSFGSDSFRNMLAFLDLFPAEFETDLTPEQVENELAWRFADGEQMLQGTEIFQMQDFARCDAIWGEKAAFPGFPTADGSTGSFFEPYGTVLAMSSACRNKDAAWEYMRRLVESKYTYSKMYTSRWGGGGSAAGCIFINQKDHDLANEVEVALGKDRDISSMPGGGFDLRHLKPLLEMPSEKDVLRYEALISATTRLYWPDDALADVVWDVIGPYLAGDRSMDETIRLLDNRVRLYVNELR